MAILIGILNAIGRHGKGKGGSSHDDADYLVTEREHPILCEDESPLLWENWQLLTTESGDWILQENYEPILF